MINKDEFYDEIIESQKIGHFTERAVDLLNEMSERIMAKYNLALVDGINREEISAFMVASTQKQLMRFNPEITGKKETAFSYFSYILRSYFVGKWLKIKKEAMKKTETV